MLHSYIFLPIDRTMLNTLLSDMIPLNSTGCFNSRLEIPGVAVIVKQHLGKFGGFTCP